MNKCMCQIKEGEEVLIKRGAWIDLYLSKDFEGYWLIALSSDGQAALHLQYCPKCGRKLEEGDEE